MSDQDYCAALARKWRTPSPDGRIWSGGRRRSPSAMPEIYDAGITTLETVLDGRQELFLPSRYL